MVARTEDGIATRIWRKQIDLRDIIRKYARPIDELDTGDKEKTMSEMTSRFLVCTLNGWRYHSLLAYVQFSIGHDVCNVPLRSLNRDVTQAVGSSA